MADQAGNPVSESMVLEEEKAQKMASVKEIEERERAQEEWANAGKEEYNGQFKKLNFLLEKSTVRTCEKIEMNAMTGVGSSTLKQLWLTRMDIRSMRVLCKTE